MIGISKLYCGTVESSDVLRYGRASHRLPSHLLQFSEDKKPVVVWNITRACNLTCDHCYASATVGPAEDELNLAEAENLIQQLVDFQSPVILFSGGEPLKHPHIFHLIQKAVSGGRRAVLSSNGLLIDHDVALRLKDLGLSYVGISLDGLADIHDEFRHLPGAFDRTLKAMETAKKVGLKVGLRFTLNRRNIHDLPVIFNLMENEGIPRVCFYHLVESGRGAALASSALSHEETRKAVDFIIERTAQSHLRNYPLEVLTVDNHADAPYLYLKLIKEGQIERAAEVLKLLKLNGGNSSGHGIGAISWNGDVHPDQFWRNIILGSLRENTFEDIWTNRENNLLMSLKNKKAHVKGRCRACVFLDICGGNLRARAFAATQDIWGEDPACYLSDEEIATPLAILEDEKEVKSLLGQAAG